MSGHAPEIADRVARRFERHADSLRCGLDQVQNATKHIEIHGRRLESIPRWARRLLFPTTVLRLEAACLTAKASIHRMNAQWEVISHDITVVGNWAAAHKIPQLASVRGEFFAVQLKHSNLCVLEEITSIENKMNLNRIDRPPCWRLRRLAEFAFSRRTYSLVIEPTLNDISEEYLAALTDLNGWKARWVTIRGWWSFWSAVVAQLPVSLAKMVFTLWRAMR